MVGKPSATSAVVYIAVFGSLWRGQPCPTKATRLAGVGRSRPIARRGPLWAGLGSSEDQVS